MRILFLDVDGVLNSADWMRRRPKRPTGLEDVAETPIDHEIRSIDPDAVAALDAIVAQSGARVVVSSSWRAMTPLTRLNHALLYRGFTGILLGATPEADQIRRKGERLGVEFASRPGRGAEIRAWLDLLPPGLVGDDEYVVLDDEEVAVPHGRLFQTDYTIGLTTDHVDQVVAMFGRGPA